MARACRNLREYGVCVDPDPSFRLKVLVLIAGVLGVFLVAFVAQRSWYWLKTRKREDVDTTKVHPVIDFTLLALGCVVIWLAIEGLILSLHLSAFPQSPPSRQKIAEIEVGRIDAVSGQLTLLFYPVDAAGQRRRGYHVPVFTTGKRFSLTMEVFRWRGVWAWLGESGFYQYVSLGGDPGSPSKDLSQRPKPSGVGGAIFLTPSLNWETTPGADVHEGEVYDVYLSSDAADVKLR
jgi:hypothetical protein